MRGRTALVLAVVLALLSVATASFAAAGGEPGKPPDPGSNRHTPTAATAGANHDPSNPDGTYRGKSGSTPDQDGIGADHGIDNNDKTGPGTDGNNGCGNDADREDDNNGWCGRPQGKGSPAPSVSPTGTATSTVGAEVLGRKFTRPSAEVAGLGLARTGAEVASVLFAALALVMLGFGVRTIAAANAKR